MNERPRIEFIPPEKCHRKPKPLANIRDRIESYKDAHSRFEDYEKKVGEHALKKHREKQQERLGRFKAFLFWHCALTSIEFLIFWRLFK